MIDTIYIARHGFRLNWVTMDWTSATGIPRDPPLAAYGAVQAEEMAKYIAEMPKKDRPTAIFTSPYYRCVQTSAPVADALQLPLYVEHGISEWYSPVKPGTGLHPRPSYAKPLTQHFPQVDPSYSNTWLVSRRGEGVEEVHERTRGFLRAFIPRVEQQFKDKHRKILLVGHAATVITLVRSLAGQDDLPVRVGTCSLSTLRRKAGTTDILGGWDVEALTQAHFLTNGVERDWGFEDIEVEAGRVVHDPGVKGTEDEVDELAGLQLDAVQAAKM